MPDSQAQGRLPDWCWARFRRWTLVVSCALLATGCVVNRTPPEINAVVSIPEAYENVARNEILRPRTGWCSDFGDPVLDRLIAEALDENFNLRAALARIDQAGAFVAQAESAMFPQIDGQLSVGRSLNPAPAPLQPAAATQYNVSVPAAYEVDVWGRIAANVNATEADAAALVADYESIAMTLAANVAETWLSVVQNRALLNLLDDQLATNQELFEVLVMRLGHGQATAPDLYQQQLQIEGLQAQRTLVEAAVETSEHNLAVLIGRSPTDRVAGQREMLPEPPPAMEIGVPADLLVQRPDLRAAQLRVAAADQRVAVAIADRLPALRISASLSLASGDITELFDDLFWSVLGSITGPIFDGGRRDAEVDRTEAVLRERVYSFAQTFLIAMNDVENALVLERQQQLYIAVLTQRAGTARASLATERQRYLYGVTDYLRVVAALQSTQNTEQALLDAERQLLSYRVQLCRAVGGNWTRDLATQRDETDEQRLDDSTSRAPVDDAPTNHDNNNNFGTNPVGPNESDDWLTSAVDEDRT